MNKDNSVNSIGSIKIEYTSQGGQKNQVSKVTDNTNNMLQQHISNKIPASSTTSSNSMFNIQLSYDIDQALDPKEWDGDICATSLHGAMEHLASDVKNIKDSLHRMGKYIWDKSINSNSNNIKNLKSVGKAVWEFLSSIYNSHWDGLYIDKTNTTFRNKVKPKFIPQIPKSMNNNKGKEIVKPTFISLIPPLIFAKLQKEVNELSKYFKKNTNSQQKKSYANATSLPKQPSLATPKNITREMLKIKKMFSNLPNKKIKKMQKIINGSKDKVKLKINITTKGPSRKQVIIPMNNNITKKFIKNSSLHVANINCALKTIKSNIIADFIHVNNKGIVITTNNISSESDLQEIEKYVKNSLSSDIENVSLPRLPQSKLYLKIVGIPYISKKTNNWISLDNIKNVLKNNHLFNDIVLVSKPCIIQVSPKSDMAIIWINIWNMQNGTNTKKVINWRFNISSFITTVQSVNMNPGIPQCKNYWKWGYIGGVCHI